MVKWKVRKDRKRWKIKVTNLMVDSAAAPLYKNIGDFFTNNAGAGAINLSVDGLMYYYDGQTFDNWVGPMTTGAFRLLDPEDLDNCAAMKLNTVQHAIQFWADTLAATLTVDSARVGINITNPSYTLDVNGEANIVDSLNVGEGLWTRKRFLSGDSVGTIFFNSVTSLIDTVFQFQTNGGIVSLVSDTVASATTIILSDTNNVVITGTTAIDSINTTSTLRNWQTVILEFTNSVTFTNGKNISCGANISASDNDFITLQRRGITYHVIAYRDNSP